MAALVALAGADALSAQTDYYNIDAGRPVRIEDAHPTERYAFELQLAPLRLERASGGVYTWEVEPEIAYGILPQTHLEVGFPTRLRDAQHPGRRLGLAGVEASLLHNLNVETRTLPALALAAEALFPVGEFAPDRVYPSGKAILTRTFQAARVHVNGAYTFGPAPSEADGHEHDLPPGQSHAEPAGHDELSRWMAGVAVDRTFPLRSMLLIGELYVEQPLDRHQDPLWNAGAGIRYQWSPKLAVDAGVGKQLSGPERGWFVTFGTAYAFAVRSLIPVSQR